MIAYIRAYLCYLVLRESALLPELSKKEWPFALDEISNKKMVPISDIEFFEVSGLSSLM